eukprot:g44795.t1
MVFRSRPRWYLTSGLHRALVPDHAGLHLELHETGRLFWSHLKTGDHAEAMPVQDTTTYHRKTTTLGQEDAMPRDHHIELG